MTVNRIRRFTAESKTERRLGMIIESQDDVIAELRWRLFIARRNSRVWFWLFVLSVVVSLVF